MKPDPILCFVVKAPDPLRSKTRLVPLSPEIRTALSAAMIEDGVSLACSMPGVRVVVACDPDPEHPFFQALASRWPVERVGQGGGDLGERLCNLSRRLQAEGAPLLFLGGDCPQLSRSTLQESLEALSRVEVVMSPAADGGYILLGLRKFAGILFYNIPWSTSRVAEITRDRLVEGGLSWEEGPAGFDIDRIEDLHKLAQFCAPGQFPGTTALLVSLGLYRPAAPE